LRKRKKIGDLIKREPEFSSNPHFHIKEKERKREWRMGI
jgi:hypothetical protein